MSDTSGGDTRLSTTYLTTLGSALPATIRSHETKGKYNEP
jgi:hypothetical protein